MASVWKRGGIWYISYEDRNGKRRTISSKMRHKRDAQTLANQLVTREMLAKHGVTNGASDKFRVTDSTPLPELLATWQQDVRARGNTSKHAVERHNQVFTLFQVGKMELFPQVTASGVQIALGELRKQGKSLQTLNHYLRAVKSFCQWLWRDGRTATNPVASLRGFNAKTDRRRERRAMAVDEVRALYKAADEGKQLWKMTGEDRGMFYRFLMGTGLRVNEARMLRGKNFLFNESPPIVLVSAAFSKHRREDRQPMRDKLGKMLKKWMKKKGIGPEDPVFTLPDKPNRMLKHDLAQAGVPVKDEHGRILDLHSIRHTYITECARQFPPKITQQLARHSTITMTMDFYVHAEESEVNTAFTNGPFMGEKGNGGDGANPQKGVG
jgi:integrase